MKLEILNRTGLLGVFIFSLSACGGSGGGAQEPDNRDLDAEPEEREVVEDYPDVSLSEIRAASVPVHQLDEYTEYQELEAEARSPYGQVYSATYLDGSSEGTTYLYIDEYGTVSPYTEVAVNEGEAVCYRRPIEDEPNTLLHGGVVRSVVAESSDEPDYEFPVENLKRDFVVTVAASGFRGVGDYSSKLDPTYVLWEDIESVEEFDVHVTFQQDDYGYLDSVSISSDMFTGASGAMIDHRVTVDETPARFLLGLERSEVDPAIFSEQRCTSTYTVAHPFSTGYQLDRHEGEPSYSVILSYDVAEDIFDSVEPGDESWLYVYNLRLIEDVSASGSTGAAGSEGYTPVCYADYSRLTFRYDAWNDIYYGFSQHDTGDTGYRQLAMIDLNAEEPTLNWLYYTLDEDGSRYVDSGYGDGYIMPGYVRPMPPEIVGEGMKQMAASLRLSGALLGDGYKQLLDQRCPE